MENRELETLVYSFLGSLHLDAKADYLGRGRPYAALSDDECRARYPMAVRAMLAGGNPDAGRVTTDLLVEMELRGFEPNQKEIEPDFQAFADRLESLRNNEEFEQDFMAKLSSYSEAATRRSN